MAKHDCFFGHCMQFHWGNDEISIYKLTPAGITHIDMLGTCVSPRSGDRLPSFTAGTAVGSSLQPMYFWVEVELGLGLF